MRWSIKACNILDEAADVLVCSANPHLTLSGGVGAELLGRYGDEMQRALKQIVSARSPHIVRQGEVVPYVNDSLPYRAILHAVAIDGWYESSPEIVENTVRLALRTAASFSAKKVTLTALATGFGKLSLAEFAEGIRELLTEEFPPIDEVLVCLLEDYRVQELGEHLGLSVDSAVPTTI